MGFFDELESPKGIKAGSNKNLDDINRYVKPALNEIGFEVTSIRGDDEVRKDLKLSESKYWSTFGKRFQKDGSGNLMKVFSKDNPSHSLVAQILVAETVKAAVKKARFNIPRNIVDSTTNENRVQDTLKGLGLNNVWLLVYSKTGWWIFMKYLDIPVEGWYLSPRGKNKSRLNRMSIHSNFLERKYLKMLTFKNMLEEQLKTKQ